MVFRLSNPYRGRGIAGLGPMPRDSVEPVARLLALCPAHRVTPLVDLPDLARRCRVARLWVKDESNRMGLGSFKALGASHAIAAEAASHVVGDDWAHALRDRVLVCASAGNHGLSVAAGAQLFGAQAVVYLAETVPDAFARRLEARGARVARAGENYEQSMEAAETDARANGWTLISDSSWPGYVDWPLRVMQGYLQLAAEISEQIDTPPTHVLLQAGVGGLAAAVAAHVRKVWGDAPYILVVEPEAAPALIDSIRRGALTTTQGPESRMGRLDCKTPSMIALAGLARDADGFATLSDEQADRAVATLADLGLQTTPSGAAGLAALLAGLDLPRDARVLAILSEGPEDG